MSSWLPSAIGRVALLLLTPTWGCDREPAGQPAAKGTAQVASPNPPPAPPIVPWFQGQWGGSAPSDDALAPITITLTIDASGRALGRSSLNLDFRGVVDGETVRLDASGPGGHGALVLRRQPGGLAGVLHYAAAGADHGQSAAFTLTRALP